ncbi:MAG: sulfatase-like hydrolase/transferase [Planctomycetales bacterium]
MRRPSASLPASNATWGRPITSLMHLKSWVKEEVNKPIAWKSLRDQQKKFQATKMAIHAAMIHRVDIEIGRVFDQIKEMEQWENTLVLFLSDNGASAEIMVRDDGHDSMASPGSAETYLCLGPGWSTTCNTPFRRHKTWTHEGGTSTPLLVAWPAGIKARGEIRRSPGHVVDIAATLLELTGAEKLADAPPAPGKSLVPTFSQTTASSEDAAAESRTIWWFHDGNKAIRMGDWKAVAPIGEPWELYHLVVDRRETQDLAVPRAEKLQELVTEWKSHVDGFTELATRDLPADVRQKVKDAANYSIEIKDKQAAGKPKRKQVLLGGKTFLLNGRHAFLMEPAKNSEAETSDAGGEKPWIFYGATLSQYPDKAESWMHQKFLDAGIAVAGIDVGEAYGSPHAFPHFEALYQKMVKDGYSKKPAMLGRSRGGLWVSSWAIKHPDRVAGIGGIYPCYDYTTYPGLKRAAPAYGVSEQVLAAQQHKLNPIKRAGVLADAKIPVFIIHGRDDKVVPLAENSAALEDVYKSKDVGRLIEVIKVDGQGHSFWPGYFQCQELVDFLVDKVRIK